MAKQNEMWKALILVGKLTAYWLAQNQSDQRSRIYHRSNFLKSMEDRVSWISRGVHFVDYKNNTSKNVCSFLSLFYPTECGCIHSFPKFLCSVLLARCLQMCSSVTLAEDLKNDIWLEKGTEFSRLALWVIHQRRCSAYLELSFPTVMISPCLWRGQALIDANTLCFSTAWVFLQCVTWGAWVMEKTHFR